MYDKYYGGYKFEKLEPGNYSIRIRSISLAGAGPWTEAIYLSIPSPPLLSLRSIILISTLGPALLLVVGVSLGIICKRHWKKRVLRTMQALISANPEYFTIMAIYQQDEWELPRYVGRVP